MANENAWLEAERQRARALARWEGEGGALGPSPEAEHTLDETELQILSRTGAAQHYPSEADNKAHRPGIARD